MLRFLGVERLCGCRFCWSIPAEERLMSRFVDYDKGARWLTMAEMAYLTDTILGGLRNRERW